MLTSLDNKLDKQIIDFLSKQGGQKVEVIFQKIFKHNHKYSIQAVYKQLRKLRAKGIVVKNKYVYSLGISWILDTLNLSRILEQNYLTKVAAHNVMPEEGKSFSWKFSDLIKLDQLWVQLITYSLNESSDKTLYSWIPHSWFYLLQSEKINRLYQTYKKQGYRYYSIMGSTDYLDRLYVESSPKELLNVSFAKAIFTPGEQIHWCFAGPYFMTLKIDAITSKKIDNIYKSIDSHAKLDFQKIFSVLNSKAALTLKIENNSTKTKKFAKKFKIFFGVK